MMKFNRSKIQQTEILLAYQNVKAWHCLGYFGCFLQKSVKPNSVAGDTFISLALGEAKKRCARRTIGRPISIIIAVFITFQGKKEL